jgi:hypothetical protein
MPDLRWDLYLGATWAFRIFKKHHEELNDLYWSHATVAEFAKRRSKTTPDTAATTATFSDVGDDTQRPPQLIKDFRDAYSSFDNWVRLNAVMSLSAYFELYLRTAVSHAIHSDPGVILGKSRAIDGITLVKINKAPESSDLVDGCVRGTWTERSNQFRKLFASLPAELAANIGELDRIRKFRNSVGHVFGREEAVNSFRANSGSEPTMDPRQMRRLSQGRLQKWMALIWKIAVAVEAQLGVSHIGEYENLLYYHINRTHRGYVKNLNGPGSIPFSKALGLIHGRGVGKAWAERLVEYYERL